MSGQKWKIWIITSVLAFLISISMIITYSLHWKWKQKQIESDIDVQSINNVVDKDIYSELADCSHLVVNLDKYWECLVDGPFGKPLEDERVIDPKDFGIQRLQRRPPTASTKKLKNIKSRRRRKREANSIATFSYKPFDDNFLLPFHAVVQGKSVPNTTNDPFRAFFESAVHLYHQLRPGDPGAEKQKQPAWSYQGEYGPRQWHKLELEKFFVPVNQKLEKTPYMRLLEASLTDRWLEEKMSGETDDDKFFGEFWSELFEMLHEGKELIPESYEKFKNNTENQSREERLSLVYNAPSNGFYSFMRFLLPPPASERQLNKHKERLPHYFKLRTPIAKLHKLLIGKLPGIRSLKKLLDSDAKDFNDNEKKLLNHINNVADVDKYQKIFYPFYEPKPVQDKSGFMVNTTKQQVEEINLEERSRSEYNIPIFPKAYPICQDKEPSPFHIDTTKAQRSSIKPYEFSNNYDKMYRIVMFFPPDGTNILSVSLKDDERLLKKSVVLAGGAARGLDLNFETMFIRVGRDKFSGTEHTIDQKSYGMELQLLFSYKGTSNLQPFWYTLARQLNDLFPYREKLVIMLSVFVNVVKNPKNPYLFEPLAQAAYKFRQQSETNPGHNKSFEYRAFESEDYVLAIRSFIPHGPFYTYRGGLTFPPCFGYILWSVYEEPLEISEEQFLEFRLMPTKGTDDNQFLAGNIRKIDDEYVAGENLPGMKESEKDRLRALRLGRTVLKSLPETSGDEPHYDYYFEYTDVASEKFVSWILLCHLIAILYLAF